METVGERFNTALQDVYKNEDNATQACVDDIGASQPSVDRGRKSTNNTITPTIKRFSKLKKVSLSWLKDGKGNMYSHSYTPSNVPIGGVSDVPIKYMNELVDIPYMRDVHGAMGEGGYVQSEDNTLMAFAPSFLRGTLGLDNFQGLHIINATGDSMEPTIHSGELLFVNPYDNEDNRIKDGAIYVILCEGGVLVKRVRQNPLKKELTLISDNVAIDDIVMKRDEMDGCQIVGRVVGHFDKL